MPAQPCHDRGSMTVATDMEPVKELRGARTAVLDGHSFEVTELFSVYWYLATERQAIFHRRARGLPAPWTTDPILRCHRFTNAYRASDRVSQYLLQRVIYDADYDAHDVVLRVLLFKVFNRIETWEHLVSAFGEPTAASFDPTLYAEALDRRFAADERLYSAAYIMPSPRLGHGRKHSDHLHLLRRLLDDGSLAQIANATSLAHLYELLLGVPSFGRFLAFQYAVDLNYSEVFDFGEMDFVVAGPGALRGIEKCFVSTGGLEAEDVIRAMAHAADEFLVDLGFQDLWGRPLQLIDCQNLFCEVDKYARVSHPHLSFGGPSRIKQTYRVNEDPLTLGYPPKWSLPYTANAPTTAPLENPAMV